MSIIKRLHHASLLVSDLAASRAFYEGVLELEPSPLRPVMGFDGVWYEIGEQQIHLLALPSPEQGLERPSHGGRDRHTALFVHDFDALIERLESTGTAFTFSQSGRRALFCRDPDGNALELME